MPAGHGRAGRGCHLAAAFPRQGWKAGAVYEIRQFRSPPERRKVCRFRNVRHLRTRLDARADEMARGLPVPSRSKLVRVFVVPCQAKRKGDGDARTVFWACRSAMAHNGRVLQVARTAMRASRAGQAVRAHRGALRHPRHLGERRRSGGNDRTARGGRTQAARKPAGLRFCR